MTERELLQRCRKGDRQAQHELYARTSERIYRLLLRMTRSPDDAFDLTQETYVRAFGRIGQFDGQASLATWLYRIAINEALQFLRRARSARAKLRAIAPGSRAESDVPGSDTRLDVSEALAALSADERAIVLLRYQEGLDYQAIGEVLGCPGGTVASRLNRARQRLRELLKESYATAEERQPPAHLKPAGRSGEVK